MAMAETVTGEEEERTITTIVTGMLEADTAMMTTIHARTVIIPIVESMMLVGTRFNRTDRVMAGTAITETRTTTATEAAGTAETTVEVSTPTKMIIRTHRLVTIPTRRMAVILATILRRMTVTTNSNRRVHRRSKAGLVAGSLVAGDRIGDRTMIRTQLTTIRGDIGILSEAAFFSITLQYCHGEVTVQYK